MHVREATYAPRTYAGLVRKLGTWPTGKWAVALGAAVALGLFAQQLAATEASFYWAFMKSLGGGLLVLALVSIAKQLWKGADVNQVGVPGGPQLGLSPEAAKATGETAENLNTRMTTQMEDVNKRLYDLEKTVLRTALRPPTRSRLGLRARRGSNGKWREIEAGDQRRKVRRGHPVQGVREEQSRLAQQG